MIIGDVKPYFSFFPIIFEGPGSSKIKTCGVISKEKWAGVWGRATLSEERDRQAAGPTPATAFFPSYR
jgi:hypothetical protein